MSVLDGFNFFIGKTLSDIAFALIVMAILAVVVIVYYIVSSIGGKK